MLGKLGRRIKLNGPVITAINISLVTPRALRKNRVRVPPDGQLHPKYKCKK